MRFAVSEIIKFQLDSCRRNFWRGVWLMWIGLFRGLNKISIRLVDRLISWQRFWICRFFKMNEKLGWWCGDLCAFVILIELFLYLWVIPIDIKFSRNFIISKLNNKWIKKKLMTVISSPGKRVNSFSWRILTLMRVTKTTPISAEIRNKNNRRTIFVHNWKILN